MEKRDVVGVRKLLRRRAGKLAETDRDTAVRNACSSGCPVPRSVASDNAPATWRWTGRSAEEHCNCPGIPCRHVETPPKLRARGRATASAKGACWLKLDRETAPASFPFVTERAPHRHDRGLYAWSEGPPIETRRTVARISDLGLHLGRWSRHPTGRDFCAREATAGCSAEAGSGRATAPRPASASSAGAISASVERTWSRHTGLRHLSTSARSTSSSQCDGRDGPSVTHVSPPETTPGRP